MTRPLIAFGHEVLAWSCDECNGSGWRGKDEVDCTEEELAQVGITIDWPEVECGACNGSGGYVTDTGQAIIRLVEKFGGRE